jgi:hypothetical protein
LGKARIPFNWAVVLTVIISLPFAMFLGRYSLDTWISFMMWGVYFEYGAVADNIRRIAIAFPWGGLFAAMWQTLATYLILHGVNAFLAEVAGDVAFISVIAYLAVVHRFTVQNVLATFQGLGLVLAAYFTGAYPHLLSSPYAQPWLAWLWASLSGIFGAILGWINKTLMFEKP